MTGLRVTNRVIAVVVGLLMLLLGVGALGWWAGWWERARIAGAEGRRLGAVMDLGAVEGIVEAPWWPWALLGAGLVLGALAVWWIVASVRRTRIASVQSVGPAPGGSLVVRTGLVTEQVSRLGEEIPGVRRVRARIVSERRHVVLAVVAQVEPDADLAAVGARLDVLAEQAALALGVDLLHVRVRLAARRREPVRAPGR